MNEHPVDWSLLPHRPLPFFGLEADFDRRDLKRAYGRLVRAYKPETHPDEFQRIRRAYEQLENQVRYGLKQQFIASQTEAWEAVVACQPASRGQATESTRREEISPSAIDLAIDNPRETFLRLRQSTEKSPQDFYILAVLSDLIPSKEANRFLKYILQGIKAHPNDTGLQQLLTEYLRADVEVKSAPAVLRASSTVLRSDVFYRLTEPLWDRVLREQTFPQFAKLLRACEENLNFVDAMAQGTFYLHVLRPAIWKADAEWVAHAFQLIEALGTELDPASEQELDFLKLVHDYIQNDRRQGDLSSVRKQVDEMIRSYCEDDWNTAMATVVKVQDNLARNSHGMIEAFPISEASSDFRLVSICMMIASDVAEQTAVEFGTLSDRQSAGQSHAALGDLRESLISLASKIDWQRRRSFIPPFIFLVVLPPLLVFSALSSGTSFLISSLVWAALASGVYFLLLKPKYLDPQFDRKINNILLKGYQDHWRPRIFRYVQSCGQSPHDALSRLHEVAHETGESNWMNIVLSFIDDDAALIIFGRAQMFVT